MNKTFLTLLIGIGIGILVAPGKGSETWKKFLAGIDDYKDKISDEANTMLDEGKSTLNKAKSKVQNAVTDFEESPKYS